MDNQTLADTPTPPAMTGTWTLIAPDGRQWQAENPIRCCRLESAERVPADVALARIMRGIDEARAEDSEVERLRAENERLCTTLGESIDARNMLDYALLKRDRELESLQSELAALRRPVVRKCAATVSTDPPQDCDAPFCGCDPAWQPCIQMLLESGWLTAAEGQNLQDKLTASGFVEIGLTRQITELQAEIARLSSPPEERREIVERHAERSQWHRSVMGASALKSTHDDITTLLEDCARWRSANAVLLVERDSYARDAQMEADLCRALHLQIESLLVERDAARAKCERLEQQQLGAKVLFQRIERLEAALQKANDSQQYFEREWFLRGERIGRLKHAIRACIDRYGKLWKDITDQEVVKILENALAAADGQPGTTGDGVAGA